MPPESIESPLHEPNRLNLNALIVFVVCFIVSVAAVMALSYGVLVAFRTAETDRDLRATGVTSGYTPPPAPRLQPSPGSQTSPQIDLVQMHAREYREFEKRGWVDPRTGQVRIPHDIANQVIALTGGHPTTQSSALTRTPPLEPGPESFPVEPPGQRARLK